MAQNKILTYNRGNNLTNEPLVITNILLRGRVAGKGIFVTVGAVTTECGFSAVFPQLLCCLVPYVMLS